MRHDEYVNEDRVSLDEIWANLGKWLDRFVPGDSKAMYGSADKMNRYVSFWSGELRKLAARYKDDQGKPITSRTLGHLPLTALRLFLLKVMRLPEAEVNSVLYKFNKHPLVGKANMRLSKPLNTKYMSRTYDADGNPSTILSYFGRYSPESLNGGDWREVEKFIDSLISAAATRKMELDYLDDEPRDGFRAKTSRGKRQDTEKEEDEISSRIAALRSGIEQILRM